MKSLYLSFFILLIASSACGDKKMQESVSEVSEDLVQTSSDMSTQEKKNKKTVLFFGDSLTAGFGLDEDESFPALIQERIDSLGMDYEVINAGLSGETTAGGKGRISWVLNQPIDIFVLELGANDMLRGLDLDETIKNLKSILDTYLQENPDGKVIIAGMQAPPNMGQDYTSRFQGIFESLASEYKAGLIPFLLDGVAGIPDLNLQDGKHPNAEGQYIVRDNVWTVLASYL